MNKKILQAIFAALIVVSPLFAGNVLAAELSGSISVTDTEVQVGENFTIRVVGSSSEKVPNMQAGVYLQGSGSGPLASNPCGNTDVCEVNALVQAAKPGIFQYYGFITADGSLSNKTDIITVNISPKDTSVPPPPGSSASPYLGIAGDECPAGQICNPLKYNKFEELLNAVVNFIFWVGITLAPLMLIIAGFLWITSAGNAGRVTTAKNWIIWTLAGLAIIILAKSLVAVLQSILGA